MSYFDDNEDYIIYGRNNHPRKKMITYHWITKKGEELEPNDMTSDHINNCLKVMEKRGEKDSKMYKYMNNIIKERENKL